MSYFPSIMQSVTPDAANTYSGTILSGVIWNNSGTGTSTMGVNAIQIVVDSTENCTIYVDQGNANNVFQITDSYKYYTYIGNFGITVQAVSAYVRVRVKNEGASTATATIDTVLCPIVEALPRSLDEDGRLVTGVTQIKGNMGRVRVSPMGALKTGSTMRLVGAGFHGNTLDSVFWASSATGTGTATLATPQTGELTLATGATANSSILVNSQRSARYIGAIPNFYRANILAPAVTTGSASYSNTRRFGAFDANDGYFFQLVQTNPASATTLSIVCRKNTSDTPVANGSFNGKWGSTYTVDTNCHTYEIWWSNKTAYFYVDDVLLHTVSAETATSIGTTSLKIGLQCLNSGGNTANNTLVVRSSTINRLGNLTTQPTSYYFANGQTAGVNLKLGPGNLLSLIIANATNNAVITLSDSITAATPVIIAHTAGATYTGVLSVDLKGIPFLTGLRLTVSGANAQLVVIYE